MSAIEELERLFNNTHLNQGNGAWSRRVILSLRQVIRDEVKQLIVEEIIREFQTKVEKKDEASDDRPGDMGNGTG